MKAKLTNIKDKLVNALNELTDQHWLAIFGFYMVALVIGSIIISSLNASAADYDSTMILKAGTYIFNNTLAIGDTEELGAEISFTSKIVDAENNVDINISCTVMGIVGSNVEENDFRLPLVVYGGITSDVVITDDYVNGDATLSYIDEFTFESFRSVTFATDQTVDDAFGTWFIANTNYNEVNVGSPSECPTLGELIADFDGHWYTFDRILQANNSTLYTEYMQTLYAWLEDGKEIGYEQGFEQGFDEGHLEGYTEGFNAGLNGGANRDPIDQYWNSTKDYILIAGQPYFAPNGFGSIDQYNTVGIYGEHESKLHRADGTTQTFNGQYVTQFASAGTLGGGWYKIGATVGDENAYEQTLTPTVNDKAYYVSRVSPLGDPTEESLVAVWLDGYEAWYVAEEYAHAGTVANNNKSYKQVYSIYMTDIRPTAQRFVNYDNPTLHETFNEDINATLYLATFNQLNNYNVYTDDIGIVESYNNGFDAGANTTLWTDLISQPVVAFFSIPLAQVIIEGVTYTLTYGTVLGAGIVGLTVIWFLKLFAGG